MTIKNRGIQRYIGIGLVAASFGFLSGCGQLDVNKPEDLQTALEKGQKLDRVIPKVTAMMTRPEDVKRYVPALVDMYLKGSNFDRDVIQVLANSIGENDQPPFLQDKAFEKAIDSPDYKQVMQAAIGVKATKNKDLQNKLLQVYEKQVNPEVKRVILETGTTIQSENITNKAVSVLDGNVDETPFALLRTSCDVLAFQRNSDTVGTLMRVVYHQDGVGRTLTANCTRALLALDKSVVAPVLLTAFKLENPALMKYVEAHPDTLTPESLRNNTANALALYRYKDAVEPMLDYLGDTRTIPVPGTLAIRPNTDQAWQMWASLVGVASQSIIFAVNDIGIRGNNRAKQILTDIFNWTLAYQSKFKNAIELTGTSNIEVSQRVNAFRALRENDLITTEETVEMINVLKDEDFQDMNKWRPFARASIGTDMVTYCAITSKKGETDTVWAAFNALKADEFNVPAPEDPDAPKKEHYNDNVSKRIDDVRPAFVLADSCGTDFDCYRKALSDKNISNYERIKAIYELGYSGKHDYFQVICDEYKNLDVFGQLYGTKSLAMLGTADDVPTIRDLIKTLGREMNQIQYQAAKPNLEGLITILENK